MGNSRVPAARRRSWTRTGDWTSERAYRELVRQHNLSHVPTILLKQFAQLGVRPAQYNSKISELEREAESNGGKLHQEAFALDVPGNRASQQRAGHRNA